MLPNLVKHGETLESRVAQALDDQPDLWLRSDSCSACQRRSAVPLASDFGETIGAFAHFGSLWAFRWKSQSAPVHSPDSTKTALMYSAAQICTALEAAILR